MRSRDNQIKTITRLLSKEEQENTDLNDKKNDVLINNLAPRSRANISNIFSTPRAPTHRVSSIRFVFRIFSSSLNDVDHFLFCPKGVPVSNPRHRRSRSTDERWLEHRAPNPVPLGTIMQPQYKKRKSVTKAEAKDIVNSKTSKYCLVSQVADTDGELETNIYKGNIIPTCGGGAQVVFDDVECLKQKSPVTSPYRKRPSTEDDTFKLDPEELMQRCSAGLQSSKKQKV